MIQFICVNTHGALHLLINEINILFNSVYHYDLVYYPIHQRKS